ncbi:MAG: mRNA surveillance protein pelota [Candidatus Hodarchaeota archaeon]
MKILQFNKKNEEITVQTENLNDLWTLYNLITENDKVSARTHRRVVLKEGTKGERKPMKLKLIVETVAFHEFSNRLRIKGKILEGPDDFVSYGTYHTFNIEIGQKLTIFKEKWLNSELKRLKESSKFESNFIILMIAIETGLSNIALITNFSHNRIATIKKTIPGKRYEQSHRKKALEDFFSSIQKVIDENLKKIKVNLIIICGPGNTRDIFIKYLKEKSNPEYLTKINSIHASSGTESGILEALKSKELISIKKNVKILQESEKIEEILTLLSIDPDLIAIGSNEVVKASQKGAVKELFCVDNLIRGATKTKKLEIENIITNVENQGGKIHILSSEHPTGQQINDLGALVAILRYKI